MKEVGLCILFQILKHLIESLAENLDGGLYPLDIFIDL